MSLDTLETSLDDQIKAIVAESLGCDIAHITHETNIVQDLRADSLDCIELAMAVEEKLNVEIMDEEMIQVETVQDLIDLVIASTAERDRAQGVGPW